MSPQCLAGKGMIVRALTVHWHQDNGPIYGASFEPGVCGVPNRTNRFVTCGGDAQARVWRLKFAAAFEETPEVEYLAALTEHTAAVNCAAFDPSGTRLATAGDDGIVRLWARSDVPPTTAGSGTGSGTGGVSSNLSEFEDSETWRLLRLCRCASVSEIYDLAWSPSGSFLAATAMDKTVSVLSVQSGRCICVLQEHRHYVQGVAWDPRGELLVSQSSDQRALVYSVAENNDDLEIKLSGRIERTPDIAFHPESFPSFFRRLRFSPDGALLIVPAARSRESGGAESGSTEGDAKSGGAESGGAESGSAEGDAARGAAASDTPFSASSGATSDATSGAASVSSSAASGATSGSECALLYTRGDLRTPSAVLPLPKPSVAASFCPIFFTRQTENPLINLPYRLVYAVATTNSVFLYSTESAAPLGMVSNLHYSSITSIEWAPDGRLLLITSIDGFCSCMRFERGELGSPLTPQPEFGPRPQPRPAAEMETPRPQTINTLQVRRK